VIFDAVVAAGSSRSPNTGLRLLFSICVICPVLT
jgi:hypothetical protein